ncbi:unannotated protein [freshwater metagenome]|uniref:Unannotated protein n=1 Tax=freshwater metagenome TaxID=449393 RepID=A0A6J7FRM6_9ZZZZ|nr:hypothetical protein [Actinomycetota bacterium]
MERWILTPTGGSPMVLPTLARRGGCRVMETRTPSPPSDVVWAARSEGQAPASRRYGNREISIKVALERPEDEWWNVTHDFGAAAPETEGDGDLPGWTGTVRRASNDGSPLPPMIRDLEGIIAAFHRNGGTAVRVFDGNERITYDVLIGQDQNGPTWDDRFYVADSTTLELSLTCAPFGRGAKRSIGTATKVAGQRLVTLDALQVPGDVPALAELRYSDAATGQAALLYAIDQPDDATRATGVQVAAADLLPVVGVTEEPIAGAVRAAGVRRVPASAASTPAGRWETAAYLRTSAGPPLAVTGQYRVLVRVRADSGAATLRLRWSGGARESGMSANAQTVTPSAGWVLVDLGIVTVRDALDGIVERLTPAAAPLSIDVLLLIPTEQSAVAYASNEVLSGVIVAADAATGDGALTGSAAGVGGTWLGAGPGPDFTRIAFGATRPAGAWRRVGLGVPSSSVEITAEVSLVDTGLADTSPIGMYLANAAGHEAFSYSRSGAGTAAPAGAWGVGLEYVRGDGVPYLLGVYVQAGARVLFGSTITLPNGFVWGAAARQVRLRVAGDQVIGDIEGHTTGTWTPPIPAAPASLIAAIAGAPPNALTFRDFVASGTGAPDRLLHPGRTAAIATGRAERTTPDGFTGAFIPEGDRPLLPPSGRAGRPVRVVMGTFRDDLRSGSDAVPNDAFTATVYATPRYLQNPDD